MSISNIKKIGVLTSGGDAPGMNPAIRAVVRAGIHFGFNVFAIKKGYHGLIHGDIEEMSLRSVSDIIHRGGTILQTARSHKFTTEEGLQKAVSMLNVFEIDAIVVIGGDGSYRGACDLSKKGIPVMCIPGTIDNDIGSTDYTIGFDTALNTVRDSIDKIRDTSYSHERCSVIEVMGRRAGYIALNVGIAGGSEVILIPEKPFDINKDIIKPIIEGKNRGKRHYIVVVAEGVGSAIEIANKIDKLTDLDTRTTVLGHIQRGGSPSTYDRVIASLMGYKAVEFLKNGIVNQVVSLKNNKIVNIEINEALSMKKEIDDELIIINKVLAL